MKLILQVHWMPYTVFPKYQVWLLSTAPTVAKRNMKDYTKVVSIKYLDSILILLLNFHSRAKVIKHSYLPVDFLR